MRIRSSFTLTKLHPFEALLFYAPLQNGAVLQPVGKRNTSSRHILRQVLCLFLRRLSHRKLYCKHPYKAVRHSITDRRWRRITKRGEHGPRANLSE